MSSVNRPRPGAAPRLPNTVAGQAAAAAAAATANGAGRKKSVGQSYNSLSPKTRLILAASLTTFALTGLYLEKYILPEGGAEARVVDYVPAGSGVGWGREEGKDKKESSRMGSVEVERR